MMRQLLLFIAIVYSIALLGQRPEMQTLEVFKKLEEYRITAIAQDKNGFLWLGTNKGLVRYDGVKYNLIEAAVITEQISSICIYNQVIYAGSINGHITAIDGRSKKLNWNKKISHSGITAMAVDSGNRIWIGTSTDGMYVVEQDQISHYSTTEGLIDQTIHDIYAEGNNVFIATDLGLSICTTISNPFTFKNFDEQNGLIDNLILRILSDGSNSIFIGSQSGKVYRYNWLDQHSEEIATCSAPIIGLHYNQNSLIATSAASDCFVIEKNDTRNFQQFKLTSSDNGINRGSIAQVVLDSESTLICTTGKHHLLVADISTLVIQQHEGLDMRGLHALYCDSMGQIWMSNSTGLYSHSGEFTENQNMKCHYKLSGKQTNIICIQEGFDNDIWFGMFGSGVGRVDLNTGKVVIYTTKNGLPNDNILSISKRGKSIWLASLGGAIEITKNGSDNYSFHKYDVNTELRSNFIYSVYATNDKVWLGTDGKGLISITNGTFEHHQKKFLDMGKTVISISPQSKQGIWMLTTDKGLQCFTGDSIIRYKMQTESENVELFNLCSDKEGNAFLLTSAGLAKVSAHATVPEFRQIPQSSHSEYLQSIAADHHGRIWIATDDGLVQMSTYSISKYMPHAQIDKLMVHLQPTDTALHQFDYTQHHFTFNFSTIWLKNPESIRYQYRLIGLDTTWITTRDGFVNYPKLSPGSYQFQLRASENSIFEFAPISSYTFNIAKPWWKNTWFILMAITLTIAVIAGISSRRLKVVRQREQMKTALLQSEFETLKNQINPHFLFNSFNTLIGTIRQDQKLAEQYVEHLSDYFRMILDQRDKNVITLSEEVNLLQQYIFLQKQRFGAKLHFTIELNESLLKTEIPPMTLQILVENCLKHNIISNQKPLKIILGSTDTHIFVSNNLQPKLSKETSTGIGLANVKNRYNILFDKTVEVKETQNAFTVLLPIIMPPSKNKL